MITHEQIKALKEFEKAVIENLERIDASGALPEDTPDTFRMAYAIILTAENKRDFHDPKTLEILRHVV